MYKIKSILKHGEKKEPQWDSFFIFQNVYLQGEAPYDSYHRFFKRNAALTSRISAGTSMRGPTTAAKAWPLASPKVAAATAMVSSKLLPVAVKATDAILS